MTPDAASLLFQMQGATTPADATSLAIDALEAGATAAEANQALDQWLTLQGRQVQQLFADHRRPSCCTGVHREHPQTADIQDYLRLKGEIS